MTNLDKLIAAVEAGKPCTVPSIRIANETMRIMVYAEGYAMVRHKGAMPFCVSVKDIVANLRAHRSQAQP